jgi:hypothetical protein
MSADNKVGQIIYNTIIIQGFESVKKGALTLTNILPNTASVAINEVISKPWLTPRIKKWMGLGDKTEDKNLNEFLSNTLGLGVSFSVVDRLMDDGSAFKTSLMKAGTISVVNYIVEAMKPNFQGI